MLAKYSVQEIAEITGLSEEEIEELQRPHRAVQQGRQDRPVRRCGRRQNRAHHGAYPQYRQRTRRLFHLHGRRRAFARRQRHDRGYGRLGRHQKHGFGLRADERTARKPYAYRVHGAHPRRIFPRRKASGRAAVHR